MAWRFGRHLHRLVQAAGEYRHTFLRCQTSRDVEVFEGGAADRMGNGHERKARGSQHLGHQLGRRHELLGDERDRWGANAFAGDAVVQTARRTTASIADTADHRMPVPSGVDRVGIGRSAVVRLGDPDDLGDAMVIAQ